MQWIKLAMPLLVLSMTMPDARAAGQRDLILGSWTWNEGGRSQADFEKAIRDEPSYTLTFDPKGRVETMVFMPHIFGSRSESGGEGLGDEGHYRLKGSRLIMTRAHQPADGWPATNGTPAPYRYSCGLRMAADGKSFKLSGCVIAGSWVRVEEQAPAPKPGGPQDGNGAVQ